MTVKVNSSASVMVAMYSPWPRPQPSPCTRTRAPCSGGDNVCPIVLRISAVVVRGGTLAGRAFAFAARRAVAGADCSSRARFRGCLKARELSSARGGSARSGAAEASCVRPAAPTAAALSVAGSRVAGPLSGRATGSADGWGPCNGEPAISRPQQLCSAACPVAVRFASLSLAGGSVALARGLLGAPSSGEEVTTTPATEASLSRTSSMGPTRCPTSNSAVAVSAGKGVSLGARASESEVART
mmetsp:Transcript_144528/g.402710  ORF Transcript_144528/g.402710 Transcript_144528/m.402710 type:complete len:243 (+) Transcript_144528:269-997(+)